MDVVLLCDIFETFCDTAFKTYRLDPSLYFTLPGFSWDAFLLHSKVEFELLTDIDMHLMIESGMRGGISSANNRYSVANHKYLSDYNP